MVFFKFAGAAMQSKPKDLLQLRGSFLGVLDGMANSTGIIVDSVQALVSDCSHV